MKMLLLNQLTRPLSLVQVVVVVVVVIISWASQARGSPRIRIYDTKWSNYYDEQPCSRIRISNTKSMYDVLEKYELPRGLLPKGVKDYSVRDDGSFEVHLDQTCEAKLENKFKFMQNITGRLSCGEMTKMAGIKTEDLFVWLTVEGIRADIPSSGVIHINASGVHKQFPSSLFDSPPNCVAVTSSITDTQKVDRVVQYRRFSQKRSGSDVM